uniref:GIY-YIG domain-containing protein n=1 Tax=Pinguiococcus pyrenoidosus TaxID=172671 RepID=A0A7R9U3E7_9STRA|mmetsp:Transcript_13361/g.49639  ORF Transcript_13361/g.49639 Transcript_13361/m.49639 type:complete len:226 (+) Transcript_13361:105-782(+)
MKSRKAYDAEEDAFLVEWAQSHPELPPCSRKLWKDPELARAWSRRLPSHAFRSEVSMLMRYVDYLAPGAKERREKEAKRKQEPVVYVLALFCSSPGCASHHAQDLSCRRTYIGETIFLKRRLRQHNGELAGGPRCTSDRACPVCSRDGEWKLAFTLHGFHALGGLKFRNRVLQTKTVEAWIQRLGKAMAMMASYPRNLALRSVCFSGRWETHHARHGAVSGPAKV